MSELLQLDQNLFFLINEDLKNPILDVLLPWWRNKYFWMPFYLFLLSFLLLNYDKKGLIIILGLILTIGISDLTSSHFIKKTVERVRPCNDIDLKKEVNLLVPCGGGYSFTSSHATNHFAIATFLILTLGLIFKWIKLPLLFWAASIAFGQVYVGVHYPLDIFFGAILGMSIGYFVYLLFLRIFGSFTP
ncbi:MAG: phosphatase PAP2 family protein [Saprospiraceae bacterium]|jgi:membrane-associated phospholipid phosphatase|nr:phosphatase PAP2 family protein [Saprospiraceae bacterium]